MRGYLVARCKCCRCQCNPHSDLSTPLRTRTTSHPRSHLLLPVSCRERYNCFHSCLCASLFAGFSFPLIAALCFRRHHPHSCESSPPLGWLPNIWGNSAPLYEDRNCRLPRAVEMSPKSRDLSSLSLPLSFRVLHNVIGNVTFAVLVVQSAPLTSIRCTIFIFQEGRS